MPTTERIENKSMPFYPISIAAILLLAVLTRIYHALNNYSMWIDEFTLSVSVINRDFGGLLQQLDYNQAAPPLFLILNKASTMLFGIHDWALKLPSYSVSIISCFAFWIVCRSFLTRHATCIALLLFTINPQTLTYAQIFKSYIYDVISVILLCYIYQRILKKPEHLLNYVAFAIVGSICLWLSYATAIVLAGLGSYCLFKFASNKQGRPLSYTCLTVALWLISFIPLYKLNLAQVSQKAHESYWAPGFLNLSDGLFGIIDWLYSMSQALTKIGTLPNMVTGVLLMSAVYLGIRKRDPFIGALCLVVAYALLLSALNIYALFNRLSLFLVPVIIWMSAYAIQHLLQWMKQQKPGSEKVLTIALLLLLYTNFSQLSNSQANVQEMRQAIAYLDTQQNKQSDVFIFSDAIPGIQFYGPSLELEWSDYSLIETASVQSLSDATHGLRSTAKEVICIWGRNYKMGSDEEFLRLYASLTNNMVEYKLYSFKNAHVLISKPNGSQ